MVWTGFRLVIGSWKIMPMSLPRMARISRSDRRDELLAAQADRAARDLRPILLGSSRMIDRLVTDLPEPLSPTMASVSPGRMTKLTPSTARTSWTLADDEGGLQVSHLEQGRLLRRLGGAGSRAAVIGQASSAVLAG